MEIWVVYSDGTKSALMRAGYYWRMADNEDVKDLVAGKVPKPIHVSHYKGPFISKEAAQRDADARIRLS